MSKLKTYVNTKMKTKTKTISARINEDKYEAFKEYCDELNISINEAINVLIDAELAPEPPNTSIKTNTEEDEYKPDPKEILAKALEETGGKGRVITEPTEENGYCVVIDESPPLHIPTWEEIYREEPEPEPKYDPNEPDPIGDLLKQHGYY